MQFNSQALEDSPSSSESRSAAIPLPTPMPGTNLPLEEVAAPKIVVSSPSAPSMHTGVAHGFFNIATSLRPGYAKQNEAGAGDYDPYAFNDADTVIVKAKPTRAASNPIEDQVRGRPEHHGADAAATRSVSGNFGHRSTRTSFGTLRPTLSSRLRSLIAEAYRPNISWSSLTLQQDAAPVSRVLI